jgi:hypothetical protein
VEVNLRMLTVKRLYQFTYRQAEWHVGDSLMLCWFCQVYFNPMPDHTTLNRWALLIQPETLHTFNDRITAIASELKVTRGRKLRTDGTVVETNIAYPSDSKLLADGVRVLSRTLKSAKKVVKDTVQLTAKTFRDRMRSARNQTRRIARRARQRSAAAKEDMQKAYQRLVYVTRATVKQAETVLDALKTESSQAAQRPVRLFDRVRLFLHPQRDHGRAVQGLFQHPLDPGSPNQLQHRLAVVHLPGSRGLGLYGMRERAELLGGRLTVESAPGAGTTVFVQVPLPDGRGGSASPCHLRAGLFGERRGLCRMKWKETAFPVALPLLEGLPLPVACLFSGGRGRHR